MPKSLSETAYQGVEYEVVRELINAKISRLLFKIRFRKFLRLSRRKTEVYQGKVKDLVRTRRRLHPNDRVGIEQIIQWLHNF